MTIRSRLALGAGILATAGLVAACSSTDSGSSSTGSDAVAASAPAAGTADGLAGGIAAPEPAGGGTGSRASDTAATAVDQQQQIISTGEVQLRADDVEQARAHVAQIASGASATVADEKSSADDSGRLRQTRLTLRVPAERFTTTMSRLAGVAELVSSSSTSEDVTTQVIDTDVRVRTQRAAIDRIRTLLARATNIRDIVSIERELSGRQATLDSLEQRQAYLADQTSLSTITLTISRTPTTTPPPPAAAEHHGFRAGLASGWAGLGHATVAVLTVLGALLPFAPAAVVLLALGWVVRRRRAVAEPS